MGRHIEGLGVAALAIVGLAWGDFAMGQPVPKDIGGRTALAYAVDALMLVAGAAMQWRRTAAWGGAILAAYFGLVVAVVMNGRVLLGHANQYLAYYGVAEPLAMAAGALVAFAACAPIGASLAARIARFAQAALGTCALVFGGAHFAYLGLTASMVPRWLPPTQETWAVATGICHIAAGAALITGIGARLAAILLTIMYAAFTPLVHIPMLLADASFASWSENAINVALTGAAWAVADSLSRERPGALRGGGGLYTVSRR